MDLSKKLSFSKIPRQLLAEKIPSLFLVTILSLLFNVSSMVAQTAPFITEWTTTSPDESITIPTFGGGYDYLIDWGDGTSTSGTSSNPSHTYTTAGTYQVQISGSFPQMNFDFSPDELKLTKILQWGDISWRSMEKAFSGCENMILVATDTPDLSNVSSTSRMFADCKLHTFAVGTFDDWDVSNVTNMSGMFSSYVTDDMEVNFGNWDVSNVRNMSRMFAGCYLTASTQIDQWDVSAVTDMSYMFAQTITGLNLNSWDVSSVTDMSAMFTGSGVVGGLGAWDVSNVTNMSRMFENSSWGGEGLENWDVSNVRDMSYMFASNDNFNKDFGGWDVSKVTDMGGMFYRARNFNQDISRWDVSKVTDMGTMFSFAQKFNKDLSSWDVSNVTDMGSMFYWATDFNKSLSAWDVGKVTDMNRLFKRTDISTANYDATLQAWAELPALQSNVRLGAEGVQFCAVAARQLLINNYGWSIQDGGASPTCIQSFKTEWTTTSPNESITIPTFGGGYDYLIDWGDGTSTSGTSSNPSHTYPAAGTYQVQIFGSFPQMNFDFSPDELKLTKILQWGDISWRSMEKAFSGCENMILVATDTPDLSNVSSTSRMFADCQLHTFAVGTFDDWDVSNVTNMSGMFSSYVTDDMEVNFGNWDVSNVRNMSRMFAGCYLTASTQIDQWDVSAVTDMSYMFAQTIMGLNLNSWDVSSVTNMSAMFTGSGVVGGLGAWDVSNVTNMSRMFENSSWGGEGLENWDVSNVRDMSYMFASNDNFNKDFGDWDVSNVTDMGGMFYSAGNFNQDISRWDVSKVTDMGTMFSFAQKFNKDLSSWDVSNVTDMGSMFYWATDFNKSLSAWDVGKVREMRRLFKRTDISTANYDATLRAWVELPALQSNVSLGAEGVQFCLGEAARCELVSNYNWTISDDGIADNCNNADISCPGDITTTIDPESCTAVVDFMVEAIAGCTSIDFTQTEGLASGAAFPSGTTINSFAVTDDLTRTCSFSVTVLDDVPPVPDMTSLPTFTGSCEVVINGAPTATDCAGQLVGTTKDPLTYATQGEYTITWTYDDGKGNTSTQNQTIIVADPIAPTAICKNFTVEIGPEGTGSLTAEDINGGSFDNCGIASMTTNAPAAFSCTAVGKETTITLTVTDDAGNSDNCTAQVSFVDVTPPTVICQDITVQLDASGTGSYLNTDLDGGSTDNCGFGPGSISFNLVTCNNVGTFQSTLVRTDQAGNSASCKANVTVVDQVAPTAVCQDITVGLNAQGNAIITPSAINNGSNDACGIAEFSLNTSSFDCANMGANTVQLNVIDNNGNTNTCEAIVTLADQVAPNAICQNTTVALDEAGLASITAFDIDKGSNDNCELANMSLNVSSFDCSDLGNNTVELSVTDVSGNTSACKATVKVEDNMAPVLQCKDVTVSLNGNGNASFRTDIVLEEMSDNCGLVPQPVPIFESFCPPAGFVVPIDFVAEDLSGNRSTCSAKITIVDDTPPQALCQDVSVQLDEFGVGSITTASINNGSNDACGLANLSLDTSDFDCSKLGDNTVELTVTDMSGNSSSCTATVKVEDNIAPVLQCKDMTVSLDENGLAKFPSNIIVEEESDNCGLAPQSLLMNEYDCTAAGSIVPISFTVQDLSGNESSCTAKVTIVDDSSPQVLCQDVSVQLDIAGNGSITVASIDNGSSDACGLANLSLSQSNFSCDEVGENTVTLTATDINGNSASCQATVTVEDHLAPTALCRDITLDITPEGIVTISGADIDNGSTDNCGIASLSASLTHFTPTEIGINTVDLSVTDTNGNSSTCSATVTINPVVIAYVWDDQDGDGKQDNGEPALAEAKVALIDHSTGNVLQALLTNLDGEAIFSVGNIASNQRLRLKFYEKADHRFGLKDQGNNDNIDSDASRSNGLTAAFTLDDDGFTDKWDAALWAPGSVQAFVWDDQDGDGKQDEGEPGLGGASVGLLESNGDLIASTITNGDGLASFSNVPADRAVRLKFYELPNLSLTRKDQGNNDNIDSDASRSNGLTSTFQANRGHQLIDSWDAGMLSAAMVKAYVWDDQDGDGKQDEGEPAIAEAKVDLLETDGTLIETAQTDASGFATFENVPTDRAVKLQFFEKADHRFSLKDQGNNDQIDSDASRSTGLTASFQASTGNQLIEQWDAGLWAPGQVEAFVWDDRDGDGKQDEGEPGIKGVEVHLLESDNQILQTAYSDESGVITFSDVPANRPVKLQFIPLANSELTLKDQGNNDNIDSDASRSTGMTSTFQASSGSQNINSWDAGLWSPGQVQAFVWDDRDGDGKQDEGEPGIKGVEVHLLESDNQILQTAYSDESGVITFSGVPANRPVKLQFIPLANFELTLKDQGNNDNIDSDASRSTGMTSTFQASSGSQNINSWDAGLWSPGQVQAFVWDDRDGDGKQDEGEPGIANVQVNLLEQGGTLISTTNTNAEGIAIFTNVPADRYVKLQFFEPADQRFTLKDQGNNDNIDSDASRSSGMTSAFQASQGAQVHEKVDGGLWSQGEIEAFVWNDLDGDGKQDEGEPGIEGVMVDLLASNNDLIISTSTDENGLAVLFDVPADRAVKLRFQAPTNYSITARDQGNNDNIDSDAKPSNGLTRTFQATMGQELFTKWDAGLVVEGSSAARLVQQGMETQSSSSVLDQEIELEENSLSLKAFPNPFSDQLTLEFFASQSGQASIEVFNLQGKKVRSLFNRDVEKGEHVQQQWDASETNGVELPAGMYLIRLTVGDQISHKKVLLQRL